MAKFKWCIFRLDNKNFKNIPKELIKFGYEDIKIYIPTVSILKKRHKGKDIYEEIPMLFSYGFMKMPIECAFNRPFLKKMQKDISGIVSFVNSLETLHRKRVRQRVDSEEFDDYSIVSVVTNKEVRRFKRLSKENHVYSFTELSSIKEDSYVTLRGYPFNGVEATVKEVNFNKKLVKVCLYPNNGSMEVYIPFDNVLYSIYHNHDENKLLVNSSLNSSTENLNNQPDESNE